MKTECPSALIGTVRSFVAEHYWFTELAAVLAQAPYAEDLTVIRDESKNFGVAGCRLLAFGDDDG
jgi:histidinol-phosphate/aromatic aminotransferase/cobyric acid decarboxylase-like protein